MNNYYLRFRIFLMALALGLASVFMTNGSLQFSDEVAVDLPKTESESPIIIFPIEGRNIYLSAGCGSRVPDDKKSRHKISKQK